MSEEEVKTEETAEAVDTAGSEEAASAPAGDKVPLQTRILGGLIDGIIAGVAAGVIGGALGAVLGGIGLIIGQAVGGAYMLLRDSILGNGQSVGKKVMKYQVVGSDGKPCTQELSIKRNITLAFGYITGVVLGIVALVPVIGPLIAGLAGMLTGLIGLGITVAEVYFVHSDNKGNRYGDKFAGTTTVAFTE